MRCLAPTSTRAALPVARAQPAKSVQRAHVAVKCAANAAGTSRRDLLQLTAASAASLLIAGAPAAQAAAAPPSKLGASDLCDEECFAAISNAERVTTSSGLQYHDIKLGRGITPPVGYQVVVDYVAMTPEGRVFDSSLAKGAPYDIRVGAEQVIPGLDEGLKTMKVGGVRRMYIPGELAFPKGVPSAAGRPRVPPSSPVVFDVWLRYIPGFDDEEE